MYFETFYVLIEKIVYWLLMLNKLKFLISTKTTVMGISWTSRNLAYGKVRTMDKSFVSNLKPTLNTTSGDMSSIIANFIWAYIKNDKA